MLAAAALLAACHDGRTVDGATQVVARVNDREISVHQLNFAVQGRTGVAPGQVAQLRRKALGRLIEQELLVQQALAADADREPAVQQQLEAARRTVLARAHLQKVAAAVAAPDRAEVDRFYGERPELFRQRRIWTFAEIGLAERPQDWPALERRLAAAGTIDEAAAILKSRGIAAAVSRGMQRGSEDMPIEALAKFAALADGDLVVYPRPPGIVVAQVLGSRAEPVELAQARPAIERFLLNRAREAAVKAEMARLQQDASITYAGEFAEVAKAAGSAGPGTPGNPARTGEAGATDKVGETGRAGTPGKAGDAGKAG